MSDLAAVAAAQLDLRERRRIAEERLAKAAEARAEAEQLAEVERLEREAMEAEKRLELEAEYGELGEVQTRLGVIFLRRPEKAFLKKVESAATRKKGEVSDADAEAFVRPHVVYPSLEEFATLTETYSLIWGACVKSLMVLAGARREDLEKK